MASSNSNTGSLAGKTALVTGGSRGIGAGIAIQFAKKGIDGIAVTYANSKEAAEGVLAECRKLGVKKTVAIHADLLDAEFGPKLIPQVLSGLDTKTLDIVVNNAVPVDMSMLEPFENITLKNFTKGFQGIVFGMISVVQAALPHLPPKGGRIINISSVASKIGNQDPMMVYGASKAAVDSFTRSLAMTQSIKTGATFNSVSIGATSTDALNKVLDMNPEAEAMFLEEFTTERRVGTPEDIAFAVGFLASEEGRWVNGSSFPVTGGSKSLLALQG